MVSLIGHRWLCRRHTVDTSRLTGFQTVGVKMRVLVVLLLGCSLAEGRLVTKCELMRELMEVMMQQKGLADENFVAKSKC